jgi:lipoprotein-anchoring transpeptidase ErfK/SrfK
MRRLVRNWVFVSILLVFIISIPFILNSLTPSAPQQEVRKAREALQKAEIVKSRQFAKAKFLKAKKYYDSALIEWAHQNNIFFLRRNFSKVKYFAQKSYKASCEAKILAEENSKDISHFVKTKIDSLDLFINKYDDLIKSLPLANDSRKSFQMAKIAFSESKLAYSVNKDLPLAMKKVTFTEERISKIKTSVSSLLRDYNVNYFTWRKLASATIEESKNDSIPAIVIDKYAKKFYIYINGSLKYKFDVELGRNWVGNKMAKNDQATPEGTYFIVQKMYASKTKYYKALLLNYPNNDDTIRFINNKRSGKIPLTACIGDMIEIHGEGGKGTNWTDGCIALRNFEMDTIFNLVSSETPVIIVGSLTKLSDIIDF